MKALDKTFEELASFGFNRTWLTCLTMWGVEFLVSDKDRAFDPEPPAVQPKLSGEAEQAGQGDDLAF